VSAIDVLVSDVLVSGNGLYLPNPDGPEPDPWGPLGPISAGGGYDHLASDDDWCGTVPRVIPVPPPDPWPGLDVSPLG
jgi:hypothetical protein